MRILIILLGFFLITSVMAGDFAITSPDLTNNKPIPIIYTCDGKNLSPKLIWSNPPANTVTYALELYNYDSVLGVYYDWIIYNIPLTMTSLAEGANKDLPDDIESADNSAGDEIYRGPCPSDAGLHHYNFEIFALNSTLDLSDTSDVDEITRTINKHKIQSAKVTVTYYH